MNGNEMEWIEKKKTKTQTNLIMNYTTLMSNSLRAWEWKWTLIQVNIRMFDKIKQMSTEF